MKWVRRSLWLAAWSLWAWLGVGLHRELTRTLGPSPCKLPAMDSSAWMAGFIGDTNEAVFERSTGNGGRLLAIYDAESGASR